MQRVSRLAAVRDAAPGEVALVVDLEAELRHAGVLAMRQLKTWRKERENVTGKARQCGALKILSPRGVQQRKPNEVFLFFFSPWLKSNILLICGTLKYSVC